MAGARNWVTRVHRCSSSYAQPCLRLQAFKDELTRRSVIEFDHRFCLKFSRVSLFLSNGGEKNQLDSMIISCAAIVSMPSVMLHMSID